MKRSVLTMITKPDERQDMWREALENYITFADEVIVVVGDIKTYNDCVSNIKVKYVHLHWPENWDYIELPRHLNYGLHHCTGDWVLKLDIDQLLDDNFFNKIRGQIGKAIKYKVRGLGLEKRAFVGNNKYRSKGKQVIMFKRDDDIRFGEMIVPDKEYAGDLCQPIIVEGWKNMFSYNLPYGKLVDFTNSNMIYWNYNYVFKTQEVSKAHFWRFVRAYKEWADIRFGVDEASSWDFFNRMVLKYYQDAQKKVKLSDHPIAIRVRIKRLTEDKLGYNLWGKVKRMEL